MSLFRRARAGIEHRVVTTFGPYGTDGIGLGDPYGSYPMDGSVPGNAFFPPTFSGTPVTDSTSLQLSTFYACVRLIADCLASLPWDSYRRQGRIRVLVDPQIPLLRQPSPDMTTYDWKHVLAVSLAMRGNFYGLVTERDALEYPTSILPLHPDWITYNRNELNGDREWWVAGQRIDSADMFHVRRFTLPGYDIGLSPIQMFRQSIGLGLAAEEFGGKWFRDGAAPSSTLTTDQTLSVDQVKQTQQQWIASHGGRRYPAVLSGGFTWKPVTITPNESQFLETRKFQVSEIARMFGVPPHMVGDVDRSTSWGTGIEQMSVGFVTYTLGPWLACIESALNQITPRGQQVKFGVEGLLRGDIKTRYEAYQIAIDSGWRNPDEVRALEDEAPIPGGKGQLFRQPLNFGPLGYDPAQNPAVTAVPGKTPAVQPPAKTPAKTPTKTPAKSATSSSD